MRNALLEAALAYGKRGWPVFPTNSAKEPLTRGGVLDATTNPAKIKEFWTKHPGANIGFDVGGAGMMCVEVDSYKPDFDPEKFKALNLPDTLMHSRSPRGGEHRFYALGDGELVAASASKLAPCVDVRSFHSYVLLPPSTTAHGSYVWESEGKPAYRTDEMIRLANSARKKSATRDVWLIEPDLPENVAKATEWLKTEAKPAIQGQGGDGMAYKTAAHLKSFGISEPVALDLIMKHWNPRCVPPWDAEEVDHLMQKVANGFRYNTSPPGNLTPAYRQAKSRELFKPVTVELPKGGTERHTGRFRFVDREGMANVQPPRWLIKDMLPVEAYAMLVGAPGTYKSFVALDIALSVAVGLPQNPLWEVEEAGAVLYIAGEGRSGMVNRVAAWEAKHNASVPANGFVLADPVPNVNDKDEVWQTFVETAASFLQPKTSYSLIVLDTVGRAMQGANENSQEHASKLTARAEQLIREFGCTLLALHHEGHEAKGRGKGSMEFIGAPDTVLALEKENDLTARLKVTKQKDGEEWKHTKLIKLEEVELAKGIKSLAVISSTLAEAGTAPQKKGRGRNQHNVSEAERLVQRQLYDRVIFECLASVPNRNFSGKKLAEKMARHPSIDGLSSEYIRTKILPMMREDKKTMAFKLYDDIHGIWRVTSTQLAAHRASVPR